MNELIESVLEVQGLVCLDCGRADLIARGSPRHLAATPKWPPFKPGLQSFICSVCYGDMWAAEPRETMRNRASIAVAGSTAVIAILHSALR